MSGLGESVPLAEAWAQTIDAARESLAAVERGELRASARQQATWRRIAERAELWSRS